MHVSEEQIEENKKRYAFSNAMFSLTDCYDSMKDVERLDFYFEQIGFDVNEITSEYYVDAIKEAMENFTITVDDLEDYSSAYSDSSLGEAVEEILNDQTA